MEHVDNTMTKGYIKGGKTVILPSSFQGRPCAMQQNYQDAIASLRLFLEQSPKKN
jgi:hypothetical protein